MDFKSKNINIALNIFLLVFDMLAYSSTNTTI